jgi:hypothetical protein
MSIEVKAAQAAALRARPQPVDPSTIPGWGVDSDPSNDPTWPMRENPELDDHGLTWERPPLQAETVEVLRSVEHNRTPAVFGTPCPPRGLSGVVRRWAFGFSESQWAHWLLLMLADRVNVVEGVAGDLREGRPPNLAREWGLASEWSHNRPALVRRLAIAFGVGVVAAGIVMRRRGARAA